MAEELFEFCIPTEQLAIYSVMIDRRGDRPFALIGRTVKGKGVSYMEHVPIWHYRSPNPQEYAQAVAELREIAE